MEDRERAVGRCSTYLRLRCGPVLASCTTIVELHVLVILEMGEATVVLRRRSRPPAAECQQDRTRRDLQGTQRHKGQATPAKSATGPIGAPAPARALRQPAISPTTSTTTRISTQLDQRTRQGPGENPPVQEPFPPFDTPDSGRHGSHAPLGRLRPCPIPKIPARFGAQPLGRSRIPNHLSPGPPRPSASDAAPSRGETPSRWPRGHAGS